MTITILLSRKTILKSNFNANSTKSLSVVFEKIYGRLHAVQQSSRRNKKFGVNSCLKFRCLSLNDSEGSPQLIIKVSKSYLIYFKVVCYVK